MSAASCSDTLAITQMGSSRAIRKSTCPAWNALPSTTPFSVTTPDTGERIGTARSEEHTSELQSRSDLVCRLLLDKNNRAHQLPPYRSVPPPTRTESSD